MTFDEHVNQSVSESRILVELDISTLNVQWINAGAGIWKVSFTNTYPEVDASLLDGFTTQAFTNIGSIRCDHLLLSRVYSLLDISSTPISFYFNITDSLLYVSLPEYDDPIIHNIWLGVISGFSKDEFTPIGVLQIYQGRLSTIPTFGYSRDPLYFGKIAYDFINIQIINTDGAFDTFADLADVYGNFLRIRFGYSDLDYNDYQLMYTGFVENITIDEDFMTIQVSDPRKQLTKNVFYYCVNKNALDAIYDLLALIGTISYSDIFFNTTDWNIAKALAPNITMIILEESPEPVIQLIEKICASIFGIFIIQPDGKYSFKMIDTSATAATTIKTLDILDRNVSIRYDPSEVLSSIRVSYDVIFDETTEEFKTWITDTQYESAVFEKYKTYIQKDFDTYLVDQTAAQAFADKVMVYAKDVHGLLTVSVPMKYYSVVFGGVVNVEINRENSIMLGTKKCEILGKTYDLENENIILNLRIT